MHDALMLLIAMISNVAGLSWLAVAMDVHWSQVFGSRRHSSLAAIVLRVLGAMALLLSLCLCLQVDHASIASLVWIMSLAASALIVAFVLAWRPRWLSVLMPRFTQ